MFMPTNSPRLPPCSQTVLFQPVIIGLSCPLVPWLAPQIACGTLALYDHNMKRMASKDLEARVALPHTRGGWPASAPQDRANRLLSCVAVCG